MTRLQAGAAGLAAVLLFLLRRFFPKRGVFAAFCAILALAGAALLWTRDAAPPAQTAQRRAHLAEQQALAAEWHAAHQSLIDRMDRNWQQYHRILADFEADAIGIETTHERLLSLAEAAREAEDALDAMEPPRALDDEPYDLVTEVILKARAYARAQRQAILRTAEAADPARQTTDAQEEQSRRLRDVMRRESPAGLFTAKEIMALREAVEPGEEGR